MSLMISQVALYRLVPDDVSWYNESYLWEGDGQFNIGGGVSDVRSFIAHLLEELRMRHADVWTQAWNNTTLYQSNMETINEW